MDDDADDHVDFPSAREAFDEVMRTPHGRREAVFTRLSERNLALAAAVRRMVDLATAETDGAPDSFTVPLVEIEAIVDAIDAEDADASSTTPLPALGSGLRALRRLGRGDRADVYLAEQSEPTSRLVAVKVFHGARGDARETARFRREARILARLEHPGIASIFGAGIVPDGRRSLVMEFVDGLPIDQACKRHSLDAAARVRLIANVCDAVDHAHRRGVIHRDLKPSNVIACGAEPDAARSPQAKVIDFGIARLLEIDPRPDSLLTRTGELVGTIAYMSPEQLAGQPADTRSDVYALGAILHELLTGRRLAVGRAIPVSGSVARVDLGDVRGLSRRRQRNLEAIIEKAVAPAALDRYSFPSGLAADLRLLLADRPVSARRASTIDRVALAFRRSPIATITVVVAIVAAVAAMTMVTVSRFQLASERAAQREQIGLMVDDVLTKLYPVVGAGPARRTITEAMLDRTETMLRVDPRDRALLEARARLVQELGNFAFEAGELGEALVLRRRALDEFETLCRRFGPDPTLDRRHAEAIVRHADALLERQEHTEARREYRRAFELLAAAHDRSPEDIGILDDFTWAFDRIHTAAELHENPDEVLSFLDRRRAAADELLRLSPDRVLSRFSVMEGHLRTAQALDKLGRSESALAHARVAVEFGRDLVAREPHRLHFCVQLGHALLTAAQCAAECGDPAAQWDHLRAADALSADLLRREPDRNEALMLRRFERAAFSDALYRDGKEYAPVLEECLAVMAEIEARAGAGRSDHEEFRSKWGRRVGRNAK